MLHQTLLRDRGLCQLAACTLHCTRTPILCSEVTALHLHKQGSRALLRPAAGKPLVTDGPTELKLPSQCEIEPFGCARLTTSSLLADFFSTPAHACRLCDQPIDVSDIRVYSSKQKPSPQPCGTCDSLSVLVESCSVCQAHVSGCQGHCSGWIQANVLAEKSLQELMTP